MQSLKRKIAYPWKFIIKIIRGKEFLAEFLGTFLLVTIGNSAIAQAVLSNDHNNLAGASFGTFQSINIGYALGLVIAVYVSIGASGAHLNPAVTWAMALTGNISWLMVVPYMIAQFLGAFFSAAVVYGLYVDGIKDIDNGSLTQTTVGIFATYPQPYLSLANGFFDQVMGTFILLIGIFAITDTKNSEVKAGLKPFMIGVVLWAIGSSMGINSGYAVNPARDFGPRLFTAMAGWDTNVVFACDFCGKIRHWWWVPIVAPMVGATIAAAVYWIFISAHHPSEEEVRFKLEGGKMKDGEQYFPINDKDLTDS